jgi:hypothetical protein
VTKLGKTGKFPPEGKLNEDDEGGLFAGIAVIGGKVAINFGTPVTWIAMTPQEAATFASLLIKRAREAARKAGTSLTVDL